MSLRNRKQSGARELPAEARSAVAAQLGRVVGLKLDFDRLEPEEQHTLAELVRKAKGSSNGQTANRRHPDLNALGKRDRRRLEKLIEKAAGTPGAFETERERQEAGAEIARLAVEARRPPRRPRYEERGAIVLSRQTAFEFVRDDILNVDHLLLLVLLQSQLENGETLGQPRARFEGDALVLDRQSRIVPARFDPRGCLDGRWPQLLGHLAANHFVEVESRGRELHVRPGSRLRKVQEGRRAA